MFVCVRMCECVRACVYACMRARMRVCAYVHIPVCAYERICVCAYVFRRVCAFLCMCVDNARMTNSKIAVKDSIVSDIYQKPYNQTDRIQCIL